jgi:hypothetical protein
MTTYKLLIQAVAGGTIYTSPILSNAPAIYAASRREIRQFTTTDFVLDQLPNTYKIDFAWDICPLDWARQMLYLDKNVEYKLTWVGSDKRIKIVLRAKIYLPVIPNAQYTDKRSMRITATVLQLTSNLPIPQPKAWYKASSILTLADGDLVNTWSDISGNGYDLTPAPWSASNVANYRANQINGKAVVDMISYRAFDGQRRAYQMANNGILFQKASIFFVASMFEYGGSGLLGHDNPDNSAQGLIVTVTNETPGNIGVKVTDNTLVFNGGSYPGYPETKPTPYSVVSLTVDFDTGQYLLRYNKTINRQGTNAGRAGVKNTPTKYVGRISPIGLNNLDMTLAELICYDAVLSESAIEQVENYLSTEYAL